MIQSFRDDVTAAIFHGGPKSKLRRVPADVLKTAQRKLNAVDAAVQLLDLSMPPGNHLEALKGDLAGYHSIRVNDQWRIVFRWLDDGPHEVWFTDYH